MSVDFALSPDGSTLRIRGEGYVTDEDFVAAHRAFFRRTDLDRLTAVISDWRLLEGRGLSPWGLRAAAEEAVAWAVRSNRVCRHAIVVDVDLVFGLARMFEAYAASGWDVRVTRDIGEAEAWLTAADPA